MARSNSPQVADSYYTVIKGKKYDRRMLELAEGLTSGRGDGRISIADAKNLLRVVKDSNNYSATEKLTMEYIRKHYKFTKEGDEFFRNEIRKWAAKKSGGKPAKSATVAKAVAKKAVPAEATTTPNQPPPPPSEVVSTAQANIKTNKGSALRQILFGLLVLIAAAVIFYYIAYKSSCAKPAENVAAPAQVSPAAPPLPAETAPAAPVANAATPIAAEPTPALNEYISKLRLGFVAEKSELTPETLKTLDEIASRMKSENVNLRITGHTCSLGEKSFNKQISEKRAALVKDALIARGLTADRLEIRGAGDEEPVGDNKTVAGRALNRRVTFAILKK